MRLIITATGHYLFYNYLILIDFYLSSACQRINLMTLSIEFFFEKDKIIQADRAYDCVGLNVQEQLLADVSFPQRCPAASAKTGNFACIRFRQTVFSTRFDPLCGNRKRKKKIKQKNRRWAHTGSADLHHPCPVPVMNVNVPADL